MERDIEIPRRLPFLLVPDGVLLPGASMKFLINTTKNLALVRSRLLNRRSSTVIGILSFDPADDEDLMTVDPCLDVVESRVGSAAVVLQLTRVNSSRQSYIVLVTGVGRITVDQVIQDTPYPVCLVERIESPTLGLQAGIHGRMEEFKEKALLLVEMLDSSNPTVRRIKKLLLTAKTQQLADIVSSIVKTSYEEKLSILQSVSLGERFEKAFPLLERQLEDVRKSQEKERRINRQELRNRNKGQQRERTGWDEVEGEETGDEILELENKLKEAELPGKALKVAVRELKRLRKMNPQMAEYPMVRHYLELMAELPWTKSTEERINIPDARKDLDADHYALDTVKKRVLEYLAVRKMNPSLKGPILCLVGPPGVGKTSIAKSIAFTLGRKFHRISLGGVSDQSDIRGHRRTYIGSMPGRLIQGLKTAGVNNPVFLLDEVDKMMAGVHGDPGAALLEVLDPEQNSNFQDHYLNVPFDLSQVLFIATANTLKTVSRPLLDRMEVLPVAGYSLEEKIPIATRHLLPRQRKEHGLKARDLEIPESVLQTIIQGYTEEAGVRTLERQLAAICRNRVVTLAEREEEDSNVIGSDFMIDDQYVEQVLGQAQYNIGIDGRVGVPGVALGLAWTQVGGKVMVVEASKVPTQDGGGKLKLTGQIGSVMTESAELALSWIRTHASQLSQDKYLLPQGEDIHIHFPAGAVEKDGPSAGVTITTSLVSLLTDRVVQPHLAMTGEISLHGLVLPVGGVKDKLLAAHRYGVKTVILPKLNMKDIPQEVVGKMEIITVSTLEQVLEAAFPDFTLDSSSLSTTSNSLTRDLSKL